MKDFNFFDHYTGSRKDFNREYFYGVALATSLILLIIAIYGFNYFKINKLNLEVVGVQQNLNLKENIAKVKSIEEEEKKLAIMNQYYSIVASISDGIIKKDIVSNNVIDKINSCVPEGVYFKEMTLDAKGIKLEAEGKDRESIAVFERALRNLALVEEVHIPIINSSSAENKNLAFSINCILKDVGNYEVK
jgi:Tfp pilus assembly protein PilN